MKVLFLTYSKSPYRVDFFEELGKNVDLTVCYEVTPKEDMEKNGRNESWYNEDDNNYKSMFLRNRHFFKKKISFDVIKLIRERKFDVIVIGGYSSLTAMVTIEYLKKKRIPFILSTDGGFPKPGENKIKYYIKKHFISSATCYLSTGKNANKYLEYYGADYTKIHIYPFTTMKEKDLNTTPTTENEKKILRKKLNLKEKFTFIAIGRFMKVKGFDLLLNSIKGIEEANFLIIGDDPTKEYLEILETNKITNVTFVGFKQKQELMEYIKASDVFVLPTRGDVWGLVINEALSLGLPVITTTKCGAGVDLVKDNKNGFLIEPDNVEKLRKKIKFFIDNREKYNEMSLNAIDSIKWYTIENEAKVHYEIFEEMLHK